MIKTRRRFSAWLLLLVFVPVMVATSLHVHVDDGGGAAECEQCLHHVRHDGHLGAFADHSFECPLCQFASLPYIAASAVVMAVVIIVYRAVYADRADGLRLGVCGVKSTRAPPVF